MKRAGRIESDRYTDVDYLQFTQPPLLRFAICVAGILTWPIILPLALLARFSDFIFRTVSELLATAPYLIGVIMRYEFYRFSLKKCGKNVSIGFGTILYYRDIEIGDNVLIGNYCMVHYCDFGSYVLAADGSQFLSGSRYHRYDRTDFPMALQGGSLRRIRIADDTWIGAGAIVMDDVGEGAIVGAGAVLTKPSEPYAIMAGNPAAKIRSRKEDNAGGPSR